MTKINTIYSTCNTKEIYRINGILCADGMHPDDQRCFLTKQKSMRKVPLIGEAERERIVSLLKAGYTNQKVCEMTHRSTYSIGKIKKEAGLSKPRKKLTIEDNSLETAIVVMRNHGVKPMQIAHLLNQEVFHVYYVLRKYKQKSKASNK